MEQVPFLVQAAPSSHSPGMRDLQRRIAGIYRELGELDPKSHSRAEALIQSVRRLEDELIGMGMVQPSCYLRM